MNESINQSVSQPTHTHTPTHTHSRTLAEVFQVYLGAGGNPVLGVPSLAGAPRRVAQAEGSGDELQAFLLSRPSWNRKVYIGLGSSAGRDHRKRHEGGRRAG